VLRGFVGGFLSTSLCLVSVQLDVLHMIPLPNAPRKLISHKGAALAFYEAFSTVKDRCSRPIKALKPFDEFLGATRFLVNVRGAGRSHPSCCESGRRFEKI